MSTDRRHQLGLQLKTTIARNQTAFNDLTNEGQAGEWLDVFHVEIG